MAELLDELLQQCRRGDEQAIATLVGRFRDWAEDLAAALVGDEHLAEDVVQNAFVRALRRLPDLRESSAFPGWFRQILRTEAHRVTRGRRESLLPEALDLAAGSVSPLAEAERDDLCRQVRAALAQLPPKGREAAELFYLREYDCGEIARRLRVPEGTVKRRLHDARIRLRQMLLGDVADAKPKPEMKQPQQRDIPL